ncbi:MAG: hypothetical protein JNL13_07645 [Chitinophagaceae bacterium]|nr:hypothetical protein [Chitinophagaceae bacterium]
MKKTIATILSFCFLGAATAQQGNTKNKVAILPFSVVSNEGGLNSDAMAKKVQAECENSFEKNTSLDVQASRTTNALLAQNDISPDKLDAMAPEELAKMLGVEFVVFGSVEIQNEGTNTIGSSSSSYESGPKRNNSNKTKASGYNVNSSSTSVKYNDHLRLEIYNDAGNKIYSETRSPFGSSMDSYRSGLDYMVKRTPYGSKHK